MIFFFFFALMRKCFFPLPSHNGVVRECKNTTTTPFDIFNHFLYWFGFTLTFLFFLDWIFGFCCSHLGCAENWWAMCFFIFSVGILLRLSLKTNIIDAIKIHWMGCEFHSLLFFFSRGCYARFEHARKSLANTNLVFGWVFVSPVKPISLLYHTPPHSSCASHRYWHFIKIKCSKMTLRQEIILYNGCDGEKQESKPSTISECAKGHGK